MLVLCQLRDHAGRMVAFFEGSYLFGFTSPIFLSAETAKEHQCPFALHNVLID